MELQFLNFLTLIFFFMFMVMVLKILRRHKTDDLTSNFPPGPRKLPLIGNMHQFVGSPPHHALREMARKHGPLMHLQLGQVFTIVVSSPEIAREVMKTHDVIFASRPHILASAIMSYNSTDIAFAPYNAYWRQLKKICTLELLNAQQVQSIRPIREEEVTKLIKWIASREGLTINLTENVLSSTYTIISRAAFGKKCKDHQKLISVIKESTKIAGGFNIADVFPHAKWLQVISWARHKIQKLQKQSDGILEDIINDHKEAKVRAEDVGGEVAEDLVDVLLKFQDSCNPDFSLTNDNIKAVILDVLGAGSETSAITVDWAMVEMMKNPRVMEKAQSEVRQVFDTTGKVDETSICEMKYLKLVVKETLRLHPPAPLLLPRECGQQCEINGYDIPVKAKVVVNAWAIGRDPKYWTEPDKFYPERFVDNYVDYRGTHFEYIPFGAGRRICPGISFGIANVELPLAMLLYHFDWKLPNGLKVEDLDMTEEFGATVRRRDCLLLIPIACKGASSK